ncbi:hypothetical protein V8E52_007917 [Russula decolorans]
MVPMPSGRRYPIVHTISILWLSHSLSCSVPWPDTRWPLQSMSGARVYCNLAYREFYRALTYSVSLQRQDFRHGNDNWFGRNPCKTRTGTHYAFAGSNLYFPMHSICGIFLRRLFPVAALSGKLGSNRVQFALKANHA